ncbi:MAG TPA: hypothetical protein VGF33_02580 [Caulobacteraceae bacterium]
MNAAIVWLLIAGPLVLTLAIFLLLTLASEIGYRFGRRRRAALPEGADHSVTATLTAGMLALLAFILGLTINFAQSRFEARRELVVTEANAIGTAWLRAKVVGGPEGEAIAGLIRQYAQTRLDFTRARADGPIEALSARTHAEARKIWDQVGQAARKAPTPITATLVTALTEMFDSAQSQRFAFLGEAPGAILDMMMLGGVIAIGAMGYEAGLRGARQPVLTSLLLLMWAGGMVMSADLNRARVGAIAVDVRPLEWTIQEIDEPRPSPDAPAGGHP